MGESNKASGSDGEEDLSVDFEDLVLSESEQSLQFETKIKTHLQSGKNERFFDKSGGLS